MDANGEKSTTARVPMFRRHAEAKRYLFDLMGVRDTERWRTPAEDAIVSAVLYLDSTMDLGQIKALTELVQAYRQHLEHAPLVEVLDLGGGG